MYGLSLNLQIIPDSLAVFILWACPIFCVNDKISFERNPFISELNGELV